MKIGNKCGSSELWLCPIWARIDAKHRKGCSLLYGTKVMQDSEDIQISSL